MGGCSKTGHSSIKARGGINLLAGEEMWGPQPCVAPPQLFISMCSLRVRAHSGDDVTLLQCGSSIKPEAKLAGRKVIPGSIAWGVEELAQGRVYLCSVATQRGLQLLCSGGLHGYGRPMEEEASTMGGEILKD